jgi:hypothetical protein
MDALKNMIDLMEASGDAVDGEAPCCPTKARSRRKKAARAGNGSSPGPVPLPAPMRAGKLPTESFAPSSWSS